MAIRIQSILCALLWIALLVFIAWPLAMFLYPFHIFLQPFASIPGGLGRLVKDIVDFIAKYVKTQCDCLADVMFCCSRRTTHCHACQFLFRHRFCTWPEVIGEAIFSLSESFPEPKSSGYTVL